MEKRKILLSFFVLGSLLASLALSGFVSGNGTRHSFAQSPGVTATDFPISSGQQPWGTAFDSAGNVWVAVPNCDPNPQCSPTGQPTIQEFNPVTSSFVAKFTLPSGYASPLFLAFDAKGNLWFPMPMANSIGMLNPSTNTFKQIPVPSSGAGPWDLTIDHNGKIWFTEHFTNKIGELDPATQTITEFSTTASNSQPYGITADASNNIWFTENNSSVALIGEYTSAGTLTEYSIRANPPSGLTPHLITADHNGNIWWTEGFVGMLGELNVGKAHPGTNDGVSEYAYPAPCSTCGGTHASGIRVDGYGRVWFDDSLQGIFGSFPNSGTGSFSVYPTPTTPNAHPHDGLNVDTHNRIWFTEEFVNKLAEVVVAHSLAQDSFQRPNQVQWGTASDGQTWGGNANSSSVFSIVNNVGEISKGNGTYNALLGPTATNAQVLFSGSLSSYTSSYLGALLRWSNTNNWYKATLNGSSLSIQKRVRGTTTTLMSAHFAPKPGTSYTLRLRVVGTTLYARIWLTGTIEPTSWMITIKDSALSSGSCGLSTKVVAGVTAGYTSFEATIP